MGIQVNLPDDNQSKNVSNGYCADEDFLDDITPPLSPPIVNGDFSEYMWMENEDEFEAQMLREMEEEELVEECLAAYRDDETNGQPSSSTAGRENATVAVAAEAAGALNVSMNSLSLAEGVQNGVQNGHVSESRSSLSRRLDRHKRQENESGSETIREQSTTMRECRSPLNPLAREFVPSGSPPSVVAPDDEQS